MVVSFRVFREGLLKVDIVRKKKGWIKLEDVWWGLVLILKVILRCFWCSFFI